MKKFAVITSIFEPSSAVKKIASLDGWNIIVVADKKTPGDWYCENVEFLSVSDQLNQKYSIIKHLPWNHYSRKMIGYLYAIAQGADLIADVDDDNIPLSNWGNIPLADEFDTLSSTENASSFVNIYRFFSNKFVWPRGFPLNLINANQPDSFHKMAFNVGVWQFLANNDPDVDALYRLLFNDVINFEDHFPIVLDTGLFCPFNSQNTIFKKEAFPLLYLPAYVSFRFTDILRGIVAQPILWSSGLRLGFASASALQERNPHDFMKDFESEFTTYLYTEKSSLLAVENTVMGLPMTKNLLGVYQSLSAEGIVSEQEIELLAAWITDIERLIN